MNSKQRYLLFGAVAVIVAMGLFPPWTEDSRREPQVHGGYYALWATPYSLPSPPVPQEGKSALNTYLRNRVAEGNYKKELKESPIFIRPLGYYSVNAGLLAVQWLGVCLVTGALWLALKPQ